MKKIKCFFVAIAIMMMLVGCPNNMGTLTTNEVDSTQKITSLQTQIDSASDGDIIDLKNAVVPNGSLTINKSVTISNANFSGGSLTVSADGVVLSNIQSASVSTNNSMKISSSSLSGLTLGSSSSSQNVIIGRGESATVFASVEMIDSTADNIVIVAANVNLSLENTSTTKVEIAETAEGATLTVSGEQTNITEIEAKADSQIIAESSISLPEIKAANNVKVTKVTMEINTEPTELIVKGLPTSLYTDQIPNFAGVSVIGSYSAKDNDGEDVIVLKPIKNFTIKIGTDVYYQNGEAKSKAKLSAKTYNVTITAGGITSTSTLTVKKRENSGTTTTIQEVDTDLISFTVTLEDVSLDAKAVALLCNQNDFDASKVNGNSTYIADVVNGKATWTITKYKVSEPFQFQFVPMPSKDTKLGDDWWRYAISGSSSYSNNENNITCNFTAKGITDGGFTIIVNKTTYGYEYWKRNFPIYGVSSSRWFNESSTSCFVIDGVSSHSTTSTTIQGGAETTGYVGRVYKCQTFTPASDGTSEPVSYDASEMIISGMMIVKFTAKNQFSALVYGQMVINCSIADNDLNKIFSECPVSAMDPSGSTTNTEAVGTISLAEDYMTAQFKTSMGTFDLVAADTDEEYGDKFGLDGTQYFCRELTATMKMTSAGSSEEQTGKQTYGDVINFKKLGEILIATNHIGPPLGSSYICTYGTEAGSIAFQHAMGFSMGDLTAGCTVAADGSSIDFCLKFSQTQAAEGQDPVTIEYIYSGTYVKVDYNFNLAGKTFVSTSANSEYTTMVFENDSSMTLYRDDGGYSRDFDCYYAGVSDTEIFVKQYSINGIMTISSDRKSISFDFTDDGSHATVDFVLDENATTTTSTTIAGGNDTTFSLAGRCYYDTQCDEPENMSEDGTYCNWATINFINDTECIFEISGMWGGTKYNYTTNYAEKTITINIDSVAGNLDDYYTGTGTITGVIAEDLSAITLSGEINLESLSGESPFKIIVDAQCLFIANSTDTNPSETQTFSLTGGKYESDNVTLSMGDDTIDLIGYIEFKDDNSGLLAMGAGYQFNFTYTTEASNKLTIAWTNQENGGSFSTGILIGILSDDQSSISISGELDMRYESTGESAKYNMAGTFEKTDDGSSGNNGGDVTTTTTTTIPSGTDTTFNLEGTRYYSAGLHTIVVTSANGTDTTTDGISTSGFFDFTGSNIVGNMFPNESGIGVHPYTISGNTIIINMNQTVTTGSATSTYTVTFTCVLSDDGQSMDVTGDMNFVVESNGSVTSSGTGTYIGTLTQVQKVDLTSVTYSADSAKINGEVITNNPVIKLEFIDNYNFKITQGDELISDNAAAMYLVVDNQLSLTSSFTIDGVMYNGALSGTISSENELILQGTLTGYNFTANESVQAVFDWTFALGDDNGSGNNGGDVTTTTTTTIPDETTTTTTTTIPSGTTTTTIPSEDLTAPTNLTAEPYGDNSVCLYWTSTGAACYWIYISETDSTSNAVYLGNKYGDGYSAGDRISQALMLSDYDYGSYYLWVRSAVESNPSEGEQSSEFSEAITFEYRSWGINDVDSIVFYDEYGYTKESTVELSDNTYVMDMSNAEEDRTIPFSLGISANPGAGWYPETTTVMQLSTSYSAYPTANNNMYNRFEFTFVKGNVYDIIWSVNEDTETGTVKIVVR